MPEGEPDERIKLEGFDELFGVEKCQLLNPKKKVLEKCLPFFKTDAEGYVTWNGIKLKTSGGYIKSIIVKGNVSWCVNPQWIYIIWMNISKYINIPEPESGKRPPRYLAYMELLISLFTGSGSLSSRHSTRMFLHSQHLYCHLQQSRSSLLILVHHHQQSYNLHQLHAAASRQQNSSLANGSHRF